MRSSDSWTWPAFEQSTLKTWCGRLVVLAASLAFSALLAGVATGECTQRDATATTSGFATAHSGAGNLIPVW
jgi:hypothetical protein